MDINTHDIFSTIKEVDYLQLMTMTFNLHSANSRNVFSIFSLKSILLQTIIHRDFQQCGMCDQQSLRSAWAYAQSALNLC